MSKTCIGSAIRNGLLISFRNFMLLDFSLFEPFCLLGELVQRITFHSCRLLWSENAPCFMSGGIHKVPKPLLHCVNNGSKYAEETTCLGHFMPRGE